MNSNKRMDLFHGVVVVSQGGAGCGQTGRVVCQFLICLTYYVLHMLYV